MNTGRYAAIVLAGGFSSRMQTFKPLLKIGSKTVTDRVIDLFADNKVEVLLVAGWRQEELKSGIRHRDITIIENPDYARGMFSSIQAGVKHLSPECPAFFVMPVDIPLVRPATVARLLQTAAGHPEKIIYPVFGNRRGHPPLIPAGLVPAITAWQQDGGLKAILESRADMALEIPVPDSYIHFDMDTPDDFKEALERFQRYEVPTEAECAAILDIYKESPEKRKHSYKVAELAVKISRALIAAGQQVDTDLAQKAAILHDIAKGSHRHDIAGGWILHEIGLGKTGDIVAVHTDLPSDNSRISLEAKIVFLADKFIGGEEPVTIDRRFQFSLERFGDNPEVKNSILQRKQRALVVKQELENLLGYPLETLVFGG